MQMAHSASFLEVCRCVDVGVALAGVTFSSTTTLSKYADCNRWRPVSVHERKRFKEAEVRG